MVGDSQRWYTDSQRESETVRDGTVRDGTETAETGQRQSETAERQLEMVQRQHRDRTETGQRQDRDSQRQGTVIGTLAEVHICPSLLTVNSLSAYS